MSIVSEIKELESLETEIKSLASRLKQLRQKKSQIEESITEYLENHLKAEIKFSIGPLQSVGQSKIINRK